MKQAIFVLLSAVSFAQINNGGGGGAAAINTLTGSAAQATITETAASKQITFAGIETGTITYPYIYTNLNSTNNNSSGALIVQTTGTSTGAVPLLVNEATAAGDIMDLFTGMTVTNGVGSGGTKRFSVTAAGDAIASNSIGTFTPPAMTPGSAGAIGFGEGTAPTNAANTAPCYADSTQHEWMCASNGASNFGMLVRRQPGAIHLTGQTASKATSTLCDTVAGACNVAGQYHVHWDFIETGTACATVTAGGVTFTLTWTDSNATAHTVVVPMVGEGASAATPLLTSSFFFQTTLANAFASGDFNISTNGTIIQYATTYTACTSGTGQYQLDATVTRLE